MKNYLQNIIEGVNEKSLSLSLNNVHAEGLFSLVLGGTEFGKLTRCFIADKKLKPFQVQLHTHRYPIKITTIKGRIVHHLAKRATKKKYENITISEYEYSSFLTGGKGLKYIGNIDVECSDFTIPTGSTIEMGIDDYHSISCSKGSMWIVEEQGFSVEKSKVLGVPFIAESLYSKPEMFQVNDKCQAVMKEIREIIKSYELTI